MRQSFASLHATKAFDRIYYVTVDDLRWALNDQRPHGDPSGKLSDSLTYSATTNRPHAIELLKDADCTVCIAGDKVPSVHLHAVNGSLMEISRALELGSGRKVLFGPLASQLHLERHRLLANFDSYQTHTLTADGLWSNGLNPAAYDQLSAEQCDYSDLLQQLEWTAIAEIEMYRGCTRKRFCSFCNEPVKSPSVVFRTIDDIVSEVTNLYAAGLRHFRLGQQTCFFSYYHRDVEKISELLDRIRNNCPDLRVLHIDNADPLAVASKSGARIAKLIVEYCTEGNCAPMGIESFDPEVIERNSLTCSSDILFRAIENINIAGAEVGPRGLPKLLPGLNIIYGLPGETFRTHQINLDGLSHILQKGWKCHRTNVRQARPFAGTMLAAQTGLGGVQANALFDEQKDEIATGYDLPMKQRVYPSGSVVKGLHSFFRTERGTWYRQLGSYPLQIVEIDAYRPLFEVKDLKITDHAGRHVYGVVA